MKNSRAIIKHKKCLQTYKFSQSEYVKTGVLSLISVFVIATLMYACDGGKNASKSSGKQEALLTKYLALEDSVQKYWDIMIADDDDKHILMRRLLLEVSYTNNYDKAKWKELNELIDKLKSQRYDQRTMKNSAKIDAYDSASFSLSDQIFIYSRAHPRFDQFPLMAELIDDINGKNNYILMHRIHYDNWVKEFNSFKKKNRKRLATSDLDINFLPIFELPS